MTALIRFNIYQWHEIHVTQYQKTAHEISLCLSKSGLYTALGFVSFFHMDRQLTSDFDQRGKVCDVIFSKNQFLLHGTFRLTANNHLAADYLITMKPHATQYQATFIVWGFKPQEQTNKSSFLVILKGIIWYSFNRACQQHSKNAIFNWNFQKYSVKIIYAIFDWVCLGYPT